MAVSVGVETRSTSPLIGASGVGAAADAVQTRPSWYVAVVGRACERSWRRVPETSSSSETAFDAVFATHRRPAPNEARSGSAPLGRLVWMLRSSSLSLYTRPSGTIGAHTEPPPTARSLSQPCSFCFCTTRFVAGSIFQIRPLPGSPAQIAPTANRRYRDDAA